MIGKSTNRLIVAGASVALLGAIGATGLGFPPPGEESAGNNLSYPVVWADGVPKALPGLPGMEPVLTGEWWWWWGTDMAGDPLSCEPNPEYADQCLGGALPGSGAIKAYLQKDPGNVWQAGTWTPPPPTELASNEVHVDLIDWGDNLESVNWYTNSMVRTEVVLFEDALLPDGGDDGVEPPWPMLEYGMRHTSGWGQTEVHGLAVISGAAELGPGARSTVYSHCARLTIQKLLVDRSDPLLADLLWVPGEGWIEPEGYPPLLGVTVFNGAVHEAGDGPGYYSAEINVKGKVIYGYTWNVRKCADLVGGKEHLAGDYRLTFSFDEDGPVALNTFFVEGVTEIIVPEEEPEESAPGDVGAVGVLRCDLNLTYMDVRIEERSGGGNGGNGGGGGKGKGGPG